MSIKRKPLKVKLVIALFSKKNIYLDKAESFLIKKYGRLDFKSKDIDFKETDYYTKEMGDKLKIRYISFSKLINRTLLPKVKHYCWKIEKKYTKNKKRKVNLDPGLLSYENFILATGKGFSHRVYLKKGVWADLTLIYTKSGYKVLDWTYPSYIKKEVHEILLKIRNIYHSQINKKDE